MESSTVMSSGFPPAWTGNSSQLGLLLEKHVCNRSNYKKNTHLFCNTWTLTSYIQSIVTGKLCERWHVVGVIGQHMGLLCDAAGRLLNALIVCVLTNQTKQALGVYRALFWFYGRHVCHSLWVSSALAVSCSLACCQRAHQWQWGWCRPVVHQRRCCLQRQGWGTDTGEFQVRDRCSNFCH